MNRTGVSCVWNQQKSYFESTKDRCPREMFVQDLLAEAAQWLEAGDQLVIAGDMNEDVRTCSLSQQLQEIGMVEILTTTYGKSGPATYTVP
jgi:hypothetical protein